MMTENANALSTDAWFNSCPAGLLILDLDEQVVAINSSLCNMLKQDPDGLIGCGREEMPSPELQGLFHPDGRLQLYIRGILSCQLKIQTQEIPDTNGMTLRCFTDISEYETLREESAKLRLQVEELTLTDELTGLANKQAFHRVLSAQVTRSRRYTNPLCLAVVEIEARVGNQALSQEVVLAVSRYLRDRLRWVDLIARWSDDQFLLILPETKLQDGSILLNKVKDDFIDTRLPEEIAHLTVHLQIGLAEWQKGNDVRILMTRSMEALAEAKEANTNLIP